MPGPCGSKVNKTNTVKFLQSRSLPMFQFTSSYQLHILSTQFGIIILLRGYYVIRSSASDCLQILALLEGFHPSPSGPSEKSRMKTNKYGVLAERY
jgi:hypothetical protein